MHSPDVAEALAELSFNVRRRVKQWKNCIRELDGDLSEGETCLAIIDGGPDQFGVGVIMLTQARLLHCDPRAGVTEMWLHDINAAQIMDDGAGRDYLVVHNAMMGQIHFAIGDVRAMDVAPTARAYREFARGLNELARAAVPPTQEPPGPPVAAAPLSTADELAKLAALKEQGIIDDDEFALAKRRLLES